VARTQEDGSKAPENKRARLTPDELVALAERMVASTDPHEVERLKKEMERGFYGDSEHS
jgi:hypothetical protein